MTINRHEASLDVRQALNVSRKVVRRIEYGRRFVATSQKTEDRADAFLASSAIEHALGIAPADTQCVAALRVVGHTTGFGDAVILPAVVGERNGLGRPEWIRGGIRPDWFFLPFRRTGRNHDVIEAMREKMAGSRQGGPVGDVPVRTFKKIPTPEIAAQDDGLDPALFGMAAYGALDPIQSLEITLAGVITDHINQGIERPLRMKQGVQRVEPAGVKCGRGMGRRHFGGGGRSFQKERRIGFPPHPLTENPRDLIRIFQPNGIRGHRQAGLAGETEARKQQQRGHGLGRRMKVAIAGLEADLPPGAACHEARPPIGCRVGFPFGGLEGFGERRRRGTFLTGADKVVAQ